MNTAIRPFGARWMFLGALVLLSACTHQPKRVDCDKRLEPINAATPAAKNPDAKAVEP
jgi:hypothetical protein